MARRGDLSKRSERDIDRADAMRLDKWIWFARFQRARETCADLVRKGHVRVNGRRIAQPGATISVGDVLTLALPGRTIVVEVLALGERRGGPETAAGLYAEREHSARSDAKIA